MLQSHTLRVAFLLLLIGSISIPGYSQAPPAKKDAPLSKADIEKGVQDIQERLKALRQKIGDLKKNTQTNPFLSDVEVYAKALEWLLFTKDFDQKDIFKKALHIADQGMERALALEKKSTPWLFKPGYTIARGYLSNLDSSIQPYSVVYPKSYGKEQTRKYPLHILLHGRNDKLTEVGFLFDARGEKAATQEDEHILLAVYGRGNNAYRWAGEADVFEAINHFLKQEKSLGREACTDPKRVVLKGFSMGGAGSWHLGLHHPDKWCVVGPGAGFVNTHGYAPGLADKLPDPQEANLTIYDAYRYAQNAFNVPVVAYSGALDKQKAAADIMEHQIKALGIPMTHLVAPGLEHRFPPEWQKKAFEAYFPHIQKGTPDYPGEIRFETYTLKYPKCHWVSLQKLHKHYDRALVKATYQDNRYDIQTTNIDRFTIQLPSQMTNKGMATFLLDNQKVPVPINLSPGKEVVFHRDTKGTWSISKEGPESSRNKSPGMQGPIDDAFTTSFLCVVGTSQPWNQGAEAFSRLELDRFRKEWKRYFRGELPVKPDTEITDQDLAGKNLVLFGDPGSNKLIRQAMPSMPFQWAKDQILWQGVKYDGKNHLPVLIQPSPFSPGRYVVFNSGHTFREADLKGTNALLYPRLGDYSLINLKNGGKPLASGLFDENWNFIGASK